MRDAPRATATDDTQPRLRTIGRAAFTVLLAAAISTAAWTLLALDADADDAPTSIERAPTAVRTATVQVAPTRATHRFHGRLRATQRATMAFTLGGRLLERPVEVGDSVTRGQVLARLDSEPLSNAVRAARADRAGVRAERSQLRRDIERTRKLVQAGAATGEALEQLEAAGNALDAAAKAAGVRVRESERVRREGTLEAEFDGTVVSVGAEPGELLAAGRPVVHIAAADRLEVELDVPERIITRLRVGDAARVHLPLADAPPVAARVSAVASGDPGPGRLFPVILDLDVASDQLLPGMSADVVFTLEAPPRLTIPLDAVVDPTGQDPKVFRLNTDQATSRADAVAIRPTGLLGDRVLIAAGGALRAGDRVVVEGQVDLIDGDDVARLEATADAH